MPPARGRATFVRAGLLGIGLALASPAPAAAVDVPPASSTTVVQPSTTTSTTRAPTSPMIVEPGRLVSPRGYLVQDGPVVAVQGTPPGFGGTSVAAPPVATTAPPSTQPRSTPPARSRALAVPAVPAAAPDAAPDTVTPEERPPVVAVDLARALEDTAAPGPRPDGSLAVPASDDGGSLRAWSTVLVLAGGALVGASLLIRRRHSRSA